MGFLNSEKVIVGYDLRNDYTQISFSCSDAGDVETLSQATGTEHFNIPTVLCKRRDNGQWLYGNEAVRCSKEQNGVLITNLLDLAVQGTQVEIEGEAFDPVSLLTLFFKRSLDRLTQTAAVKKISAIMITCEEIDSRILEVLRIIVGALPVKAEKISFQSHAESFYSYVVHQPKEMWTFQSILFSYQNNTIKIYRMECNRRTKPIVAYIDEIEYQFFRVSPFSEIEAVRAKEIAQLDAGFLQVAEEVCGNNMVSSIFLIGEGFEQDWMKESLKYLCRGRRVFQGNNLFSKGACLGMQEKITPTDLSRTHVFLGNDKLKANVGMKVYRQGEENYMALMDAGLNWYDSEKEMELYLRDGNEIALTITPLTGKNGKLAQISLEDFPEGPARIKLQLYMQTDRILTVEIEDLGLGEFRPATGRIWKERIEIY